MIKIRLKHNTITHFYKAKYLWAEEMDQWQREVSILS